MDTERQVTQLEADVREIYRLVEKVDGAIERVDGSVIEARAMVRRQGNRLDSLEANVAQLADDVTELKGSVAEILELLRN